MRKFLRFGAERLEILDQDDSILRFRDIASALSFVQRFKDDKAAIAALRQEAVRVSRNLPDPGKDEFFDEIAALLLSGQLKILRSPLKSSRRSSEQDEQPSTVQPTAKATAKPGNWIEIYLRDDDGQPVPGERYRIKLPDGSIQEGLLDSFGHAEYDNINAGVCEVCFPDLDDAAWEKVKAF